MIDNDPVSGPAPRPVGERIAHHLAARGLSVATLATLTGLSATILGRLVEGRLLPTAEMLGKIANALDVQPGALLAYGYSPDFILSRAGEGPRLVSRDGGFVARALSPFQGDRPFEFYGLDLAPGHLHPFEAHPPGTYALLTVHAGTVEIRIAHEPSRILHPGDWTRFLADVPHSYRALDDAPASLYLVTSYQRPAAG